MNAIDELQNPSDQFYTSDLVDLRSSRFFPITIPNTHHQLRQYINTVDKNRVFIADRRLIYCLHTLTGRFRLLGLLPFEPKCIDSAAGWIGFGGSDHGDCAFMHICEDERGNPTLARDVLARQERRRSDRESTSSGERSSRSSNGSNPQQPGQPREGTENHAQQQQQWQQTGTPPPLPRHYEEVQIRQLGGSIMNSCTIDPLPGDDSFSEEIIAVLTNNDTRVIIYSITEGIVVHSLTHKACVNFAKISPDHSILITVGDDQRTYFYSVLPTQLVRAELPDGRRLRQWTFTLRYIHEMQIPRGCDSCAFTVTYARGSDKCAVGCQDGSVYIYLLDRVFDRARLDPKEKDDNVVYAVIKASRNSVSGGAVRTMQFSPQPWDLLVWAEDFGRVTIFDVRRNFMRRQVISLDTSAEEVNKMDVFYEQDSEEDHARRLLTEGLLRRPVQPNPSVCDEDSPTQTYSSWSALTETENNGDSTVAGERENRDQLLNSEASRDWFRRQYAHGVPASTTQRGGVASEWHRGQSQSSQSEAPTVPPSSGPSPRQQPASLARPGGQQPTAGPATQRPSTQDTNVSSRSHPPSHVQVQQPERTRQSAARMQTVRESIAHLQRDASLVPPDMTTSAGAATRLQALADPHTPQAQTSVERAAAADRAAAVATAEAATAAVIFPQQRARRESTSNSNSNVAAATAVNAPAAPAPAPAVAAPPARQRSGSDQSSRRNSDYFSGFSFPPNTSRPSSGGQNVDPRGPGTAGIGWSPDGRHLYVAIERGIFEFRVNVQDRSVLPALDMA